MTLLSNTAHRVRGPSARLALVQALRDVAASEPETDWIEWKREADLTAKAWQGELATHILGFANRDLRSAARNVEGYGYLIVGAEAGSVSGIEPLDPAQLDDGIARFLGGAEGPGWEPAYVELDGKQVLVISVEPPQAGDPIWPLRKAFTDPAGNTHHDGRIFIRRLGKTSPQPTSAEIDMLQKRSQRSRSGLDLEVAVRGDATISPVDLGESGQRSWRHRERARHLANLSANSAVTPPAHFVIRSSFDEHRTPTGFRGEVDDYLDQAAEVFPQIARAEAVDAGIGRLQLSVHNNSEDNFHKLLLELYVEGEVTAFFDAEEARESFDPPEPPREFGTSRFAGLGLANFEVPSVRPFNHGAIDNSASARIHFPVFDLRPGYQRDLDDLFLLVDQSFAGAELLAKWTATSTSVSGSAAGELGIAIAPEAILVGDL
jgi:hypothetical protein